MKQDEIKKTTRTITPDDYKRFLEYYGKPEPIQDTSEAEYDSQLNSAIQWVIEKCDSGNIEIVDIGCGKGVLLERLIQNEIFTNFNEIFYMAIDDEEKLSSVNNTVFKNRVHKYCDYKTLDEFYKKWPDGRNIRRIIFIRNVLHELNILKTANLFSHIANNINTSDVLFIQDFLCFPKIERHNVCWDRGFLEEVLKKLGFTNVRAIKLPSRSGNRWFNLTATTEVKSQIELNETEKVVFDGRLNQHKFWSRLGALQEEGLHERLKELEWLDFDLQFGYLTRQLNDFDSTFIPPLTDKQTEVLKNSTFINSIDQFIKQNILEHSNLSQFNGFRERGKQLDIGENFLRDKERCLAIVYGGKSFGKRTFITQLLASRSYDKTPIIINVEQGLDCWNLIEEILSKSGLRLNAEIISLLPELSWENTKPIFRRFFEVFATRMIIALCNFDNFLDPNGNFDDDNILSFLKLFIEQDGSKLIISSKADYIPNELSIGQNQLEESIHIGRFGSDEPIINILDDYFDRGPTGLEQYPEKLLSLIGRHPALAEIVGRNLRHSGQKLLNDKAFLKEIEYDLREYLWKRLIDKESFDSLKVFSQLRIAVPKTIIKNLSSEYSLRKSISSGLLFEIYDPFWTNLVDGIGVLRLRQIGDGISSDLDNIKHKEDTFDQNKHKTVAQLYHDVYSKDDDPKWLRESYYHKILSGDDNFIGQLGDYYWRELCSSASYIFSTKKDYELSLKLFNYANEIRNLLRYSRMHKASCLVRIGKEKEGLKEYTALFEEYPDKIGVKTSYVDALLYKHMYTESITFLKEQELSPDSSPWIAGQWGRAYLGKNNYSKALESFFLQKKLSNLLTPFIFVSIARVYRYMGRINLALDLIEEGLEVFANSDSLKLLKGSTLEVLGKNDEAYEILQALFIKVPHSPDVALPLIKILLKKDDLHNAKKVLSRCKNLIDNHSPVLVTAEAEILKRTNPKAAIDLLRRQDDDDQNITGMLLETYFSAGLMETTSDKRITIAEEGMGIEVPESLLNNAMIVINLCRLSILANNHQKYSELIERLIDMEVEESELDKLISLCDQFMPNQKG